MDVEPSRTVAGNAEAANNTYSTQASRSGAEPRHVVHPGRRLIDMVLVSNRLEHAGGDERRALWKQQPADEQVSLRTGRPIGCGGCDLTLLSRVSRRSWVISCNIFRRSEDMQSSVNELIVRLMQHSTPSHSSTSSSLFDIERPCGSSQRAACDEPHEASCICSVARAVFSRPNM